MPSHGGDPFAATNEIEQVDAGVPRGLMHRLGLSGEKPGNDDAAFGRERVRDVWHQFDEEIAEKIGGDDIETPT